MPWVVRSMGDGRWGVYKNLGNDKVELKSHHDSKIKAMKAVALLRGVEHGWKPTKNT